MLDRHARGYVRAAHPPVSAALAPSEHTGRSPTLDRSPPNQIPGHRGGHGDIDPVVDRLAHHIGLASAQPGGLEAIRHVLYYLDERTESPASTRRLLSRLPPDAKEVYMTVAQQLRREGREEGREEGRAEAREELLVSLFRQRFGDVAPRHIERIRHADAATRERWLAGVFTAASLDDLLA